MLYDLRWRQRHLVEPPGEVVMALGLAVPKAAAAAARVKEAEEMVAAEEGVV